MRHKGIERRKKLKEEIAQFEAFQKLMRYDIEKETRKINRKKHNSNP